MILSPSPHQAHNDMEPSAKMLQLIEYLKEAEEAGDKTICYSQCTCVLVLLRFGTYVFLNFFCTGTSMLDLVEVLFSRFVVYGSMERWIGLREIILLRSSRSLKGQKSSSLVYDLEVSGKFLHSALFCYSCVEIFF
jgi:hypothetical protein